MTHLRRKAALARAASSARISFGGGDDVEKSDPTLSFFRVSDKMGPGKEGWVALIWKGETPKGGRNALRSFDAQDDGPLEEGPQAAAEPVDEAQFERIKDLLKPVARHFNNAAELVRLRRVRPLTPPPLSQAVEQSSRPSHRAFLQLKIDAGNSVVKFDNGPVTLQPHVLVPPSQAFEILLREKKALDAASRPFTAPDLAAMKRKAAASRPQTQRKLRQGKERPSAVKDEKGVGLHGIRGGGFRASMIETETSWSGVSIVALSAPKDDKGLLSARLKDANYEFGRTAKELNQQRRRLLQVIQSTAERAEAAARVPSAGFSKWTDTDPDVSRVVTARGARAAYASVLTSTLGEQLLLPQPLDQTLALSVELPARQEAMEGAPVVPAAWGPFGGSEEGPFVVDRLADEFDEEVRVLSMQKPPSGRSSGAAPLIKSSVDVTASRNSWAGWAVEEDPAILTGTLKPSSSESVKRRVPAVDLSAISAQVGTATPRPATERRERGFEKPAGGAASARGSSESAGRLRVGRLAPTLGVQGTVVGGTRYF